MDENSLKSSDSMVKIKNITEKAGSLLGAVKYDLIGEIAKEPRLNRKTVVSILQKIKANTFHQFQVTLKALSKKSLKSSTMKKSPL